jgi:hypothetical protein
MNTPILLGTLFLIIGLSVWFYYKEAARRRKQLAALEQEQREQMRARYEDTEAGLQEWLKALKLPQLEEQTRLEAASRQLRTVLSDRLMRMPRVD